MRTIIAGGREFSNYSLMCEELQKEIITVILSGNARGADQLGEQYARQNGIMLELYPAQWRVNGVFDRSAGFARNFTMAQRAEALIAFWDGESHGTAHMIHTAKAYKLKTRIVHYDPRNS